MHGLVLSALLMLWQKARRSIARQRLLRSESRVPNGKRKSALSKVRCAIEAANLSYWPMGQNTSYTVPLALYKAALDRRLLGEDEVLLRPQDENGAELVLQLDRGLSLKTLQQLAKCRNRADLIERALAQNWSF